MALSDGIGRPQDYDQMNDRLKQRKTALEELDFKKAAAMSAEQVYVDDSGNTWTYVIAAEQVIIVKCQPVNELSVLIIPNQIKDYPVVVIGMDSCSSLEAPICEIVCPDSVLKIEQAAFRNNSNLKKITFPKHVDAFDSHWIRGCKNLSHLVLPGGLRQIKANIFDMSELEILEVGECLESVDVGAFAKSKLECIKIDSNNPFLCTDGLAIYTKDKAECVALAVPCESYSVLSDCIAISKKAFGSFSSLVSVVLPDSLVSIAPFAFFGCGITSFYAPKSLKVISEKAFFNCSNLKEIELNEGLEVIEKNAFTNTAISSLRIPGTIKHIDFPVSDGCGLTYSGDSATFSIEDGEGGLSLDSYGVLFERKSEGHILLKAIDDLLVNYAIPEGVTRIAENAFANHPNLVSVELPASLRVIEDRAFKGCGSLKHVGFNEGLEEIGEEAFNESSLSAVYVPSTLRKIGYKALVTKGARVISEPPTIEQLEVSPDNQVFSEKDGFLLEKKPNGKYKLVLARCTITEAHIPDDVEELSPYALNGICGLTELRISTGISKIGSRALAVGDLVRTVTVDVLPDETHEVAEKHIFRFPKTDRGEQQLLIALGRMPSVDLEDLYLNYDAAVICASSFDQSSNSRLSLYSQVKKALRRVKDPVFMADVNKSMYESLFTSKIVPVCVCIAKRDDRDSLNTLFELGFINGENISEVIDAVSVLQDAAITDYLLEMKRLRYGRRSTDFDL